jgi:hypothetical protein
MKTRKSANDAKIESDKELIGRQISETPPDQPSIMQPPLNPTSSTNFNQQPNKTQQKNIKRKRNKGKNNQKKM